MENLNAEQVKKALECCVKRDDAQICNDCPLSETRCAILLPDNALALINSQEQRIGELAEEVETLTKAKYIFSTVDYCADDLSKALEENKRLTEENERLRLKDAENAISAFRDAAVILDLQQRLNHTTEENHNLYRLCMKAMLESGHTADQIAKEMLEGVGDAGE